MPRKSYYEANKEKCKAAARAWHLANPEKVNETKLKHRDKKAELEGRTVHTGRRSRVRRPRPPRPEPSSGLTPVAIELVRRVSARLGPSREGSDSPNPEGRSFRREGSGYLIDDDERVMTLDEHGNLIPYIEGDEILNAENEAMGAGRRSLMDQHAEDQRRYYEEHIECERERSRIYGATHPEIRQNRRRNSIDDLKYNTGTRRTLLRQRRIRVIMHYSGDRFGCVICGEATERLLTIDYIDTNRDSKTRYSSDELYRRLEKDGYPDGYRTICKACQHNIRKLNTTKMKVERLDVLSGIDRTRRTNF